VFRRSKYLCWACDIREIVRAKERPSQDGYVELTIKVMGPNAFKGSGSVATSAEGKAGDSSFFELSHLVSDERFTFNWKKALGGTLYVFDEFMLESRWWGAKFGMFISTLDGSEFGAHACYEPWAAPTT
jgi:hypothetical protein